MQVEQAYLIPLIYIELGKKKKERERDRGIVEYINIEFIYITSAFFYNKNKYRRNKERERENKKRSMYMLYV